jgi:hypothetical protein
MPDKDDEGKHSKTGKRRSSFTQARDRARSLAEAARLTADATLQAAEVAARRAKAKAAVVAAGTAKTAAGAIHTAAESAVEYSRSKIFEDPKLRTLIEKHLKSADVKRLKEFSLTDAQIISIQDETMRQLRGNIRNWHGMVVDKNPIDINNYHNPDSKELKQIAALLQNLTESDRRSFLTNVEANADQLPEKEANQLITMLFARIIHKVNKGQNIEDILEEVFRDKSTQIMLFRITGKFILSNVPQAPALERRHSTGNLHDDHDGTPQRHRRSRRNST